MIRPATFLTFLFPAEHLSLSSHAPSLLVSGWKIREAPVITHPFCAPT
jgi:hypothetical protein